MLPVLFQRISLLLLSMDRWTKTCLNTFRVSFIPLLCKYGVSLKYISICVYLDFWGSIFMLVHGQQLSKRQQIANITSIIYLSKVSWTHPYGTIFSCVASRRWRVPCFVRCPAIVTTPTSAETASAAFPIDDNTITTCHLCLQHWWPFEIHLRLQFTMFSRRLWPWRWSV